MKYYIAKIALNYCKYKKQLIVGCAFDQTNKNALKIMQTWKVKFVIFALNWTNEIAVKILQILEAKFAKFALN